jgi:hypothetical protein
MSFIAFGTEGRKARRRPLSLVSIGASVGAPITTTTDDVDVQVNVLSTNLDNLDRAITDWYTAVRDKKNKKFDQFAAGWDHYRQSARNFIYQWRTQGLAFLKAKLTPGARYPGPWLKLAWNYYDNARAHQENVRKWRLAWNKLSGEAEVTPEGGGQPPPEPKGAGSVILYGALALGGVFAASKLIEAVKK